MTSSSSSEIPRRPLPGGKRTLSLLGFSVEGGSGTASSPGIVQRLRRARASGVTTFDVVGSSDPARARWLLSEAFTDPDPEIVVVLPDVSEAPTGSSARSHFSNPPTSAGGPSPFGIGSSSATTTILQLDSDRERSQEGPTPSRRADSDGGTHTFRALRLDPSTERLPETTEGTLFTGPYSLLDSRLGRLLDRSSPNSVPSFLARDPFAAGRLDGTRFSGNWLERGPSAAPSSLRTLVSEFEPVLRLNFLTAGRKRTLAQAALQFAGYRGWASCVLTPLPTVDRMEEILTAFRCPALTEEEVRQVEHGGPDRASLPVAGDIRRSNSHAD